MHTKLKVFLEYVSKVVFAGSKEELNKVLQELDATEAAPTQEELESAKQLLLQQIEHLTKDNFHPENYQLELTKKNQLLVDFDEVSIRYANFHLFNLYMEAIAGLSTELDQYPSNGAKKQFLNNLLAEVESYREIFTTNYHNIRHVQKEGRIPKAIMPNNTWALTEMYKRYFNSLYSHITSLHGLLHTSLDTLREVQGKTPARLIWVYREGTEGRAFGHFYERLLAAGYIENTSLRNFSEVFKGTDCSFKKITWLGTLSELNFLISQLKKRKAVVSVGDIWMATASTFVQENQLDFNYDSLQRTPYLSFKPRKKIDAILAHIKA